MKTTQHGPKTSSTHCTGISTKHWLSGTACLRSASAIPTAIPTTVSAAYSWATASDHRLEFLFYFLRKYLFQRYFPSLVITTPGFGPDPAQITCPSCGQVIVTKIDYESSTKTHLMAGLLCLLVWPCFWLPYVIESCKNANHYCTNCSAYLGTYRGS